MLNLENDIAKQREITICFEFEQKDTKFIINAKSEDVLYVGEMELNPFCTFEDVAKALEMNQYILTTKTSEVLKIKVGGFFSLNFVSKQKLTLDELRQTIKQLTVKVDNEIQNNLKLKTIVETHQIQIQQLKADRLSLREEIKKINQKQLDQQKIFLRNSQQIDLLCQTGKTEKENARKNQADTQQKISELKEVDNKQRTQIQSSQVALNQQRQKVATLRTQLNDLSAKINNFFKQKLPKSLDFEKMFFTSSKVISTSQEKLTIKGFFPNKNITGAQLLFRASDYGFDVKKFHEKCDNIPNTLVVCHTEFDKKSGGFTPLTWTSPGNDQHKADDTRQTCVFSLTHNHKFTLQNTTYAICCRDSSGPFFGYHSGSADIWIHNNADKNNNGGTCPNNCFYNGNYTKMNKDSFQMFSGNPNSTYYFKVKEWEVWGLKFE